jgi:hypothetical protein
MIMLANSKWFVLKRSARNPEGMFIKSETILGTVAISEASRRLS